MKDKRIVCCECEERQNPEEVMFFYRGRWICNRCFKLELKELTAIQIADRMGIENELAQTLYESRVEDWEG